MRASRWFAAHDGHDAEATVVHARQAGAVGPQHVKVLGHVTEIADLMIRADLAVATAGGSAWERALLKLPSLVVAVTAEESAVRVTPVPACRGSRFRSAPDAGVLCQLMPERGILDSGSTAASSG